MFKNYPLRLFDIVFDGFGDSSSFSKPIFLPSVKGSLDAVLKEILKLVEENRFNKEDPTVQTLQRYLTEAQVSLKVGIADTLRVLNTASHERESGIRIRCFYEMDPKPVSQELVQRSLLSFKALLNHYRQENKEVMKDFFEKLIAFNNKLDDDMACVVVYG